jgi:hypothetical protein
MRRDRPSRHSRSRHDAWSVVTGILVAMAVWGYRADHRARGFHGGPDNSAPYMDRRARGRPGHADRGRREARGERGNQDQDANRFQHEHSQPKAWQPKAWQPKALQPRHGNQGLAPASETQALPFGKRGAQLTPRAGHPRCRTPPRRWRHRRAGRDRDSPPAGRGDGRGQKSAMRE